MIFSLDRKSNIFKLEMGVWRASSVAKHPSPFCIWWLRLCVCVPQRAVALWQALPLACSHTWLLTGLYLSPGLFMIISSCLRLKLDTPIDFAKPASLHASRAYKESKDNSPTGWLDFLGHAF